MKRYDILVIGGAAVRTGTIPSKTLREAVLYLAGWNQRGLYGNGYRLKPRGTIDDLMQRLHITIFSRFRILFNHILEITFAGSGG
jgi:NAD(P) transhydrogenase